MGFNFDRRLLGKAPPIGELPRKRPYDMVFGAPNFRHRVVKNLLISPLLEISHNGGKFGSSRNGVSQRIRRRFADPRYFPHSRPPAIQAAGGEKATGRPIRRDSRRFVYPTLQKSASHRTPIPFADVATCDLSDYCIAQSAHRPSTPIPRGVVGNARSPRNCARWPTERNGAVKWRNYN